jgi:L-asparaginase
MSIREFQVGGTLDAKESVYVSRAADETFLKCLSKGKAWINIYGCRTMGKSSLYTQHLSRLRREGKKPIVIDLSACVGDSAKTGREWVRALGEAVAAELHIKSNRFISSVTNLSTEATAGTVLDRLITDCIQKLFKEPVILILDEYDYIQELDFCEELLTAFRHIQSLQARSDRLDGVSICFVGLQPIASLGEAGSANTSIYTTPIEMADFEFNTSAVEALMRGFRGRHPEEPMLRRIFGLSGGQPLMTMALLDAAKKGDCWTPRAVDKMARGLIEGSRQGKELQLFFKAIERAIVAEGGDAFGALRVYESLLEGSKEAQGAPEAELLLLFGLVRRRNELIEVKGDLFRWRFDRAWTDKMLSLTASGMRQHRGRVRGKRTGKICVINTGGTLGMIQRGKKVVPPRDADEFKSYFSSLDSIAEVIEFINLLQPPRDSINVFPDQWVTIASYIYNRRDQGFDGFVVAHGTDTMAYTASAVAFALGPHLNFPVVFTGAQTTPDVAYGDAHVNLYRACEVAKKDIPEVVISFGNFVYRAVRAQKKDDRRFDGFESPTYPPLAEITGEINVRNELLRPKPRRKRDIELRANFETSILIVPQFPGLEPDFFEHLLNDRNGEKTCRGVIVQTLGAGNVASEEPYSFIPFVRRAYRQGIPVIVTSQYPPDPGTHTKYTPAEAPIKAGAIHAGNMTLAAAVAKFRWVLADVNRRRGWQRITPAEKRSLVSKLMVEKAVVGEF